MSQEDEVGTTWALDFETDTLTNQESIGVKIKEESN